MCHKRKSYTSDLSDEQWLKIKGYLPLTHHGAGCPIEIDMREAIKAYTQGPAYAAGMEDRLGMLAENYLADLVILDKDLFTVEPMEILEINVMGTMVGGRWRYRNI